MLTIKLLFYLALFLTQQAANGTFCQTKIDFILAYKNCEFYTKRFRLRKERDTTRLHELKDSKLQLNFLVTSV